MAKLTGVEARDRELWMLYQLVDGTRPLGLRGFAVWEGELQLFGGISTSEVSEACSKLVEQIEKAKFVVSREEAQAAAQEGREAEARGQDERY